MLDETPRSTKLTVAWSLFALLALVNPATAFSSPAIETTVQEVLEPAQEPAEDAESDQTPAAPEIPAESQEKESEDGITITLSDDRDDDRRGRRRHHRSIDKDTQIHLGSDLVIEEDEVARDAIVFLGSLHVKGKVIGDAIAFLGPVTIDGEVTGEVVAIGSSVTIGPDAEILGDIISLGGRVERHPEARILGEISEIDFGPAIHWSDMPMFWRLGGPQLWDLWHMGMGWGVFLTLFKWILLILIVSFIFVAAREPVERTRRQLRAEPWKSSLVGLVALVFFPFVFVMVCVILAITIIGIPLLIVVIPLVFLLLVFALFLGYAAAAHSVGEWVAKRIGWSITSPYVALMIGVVAIQLLSLLARIVGSVSGMLWFFALLFAIAGWFIRFAAWTAGFGAALLTQLGRLDPVGMTLPPSPAGSSVIGSSVAGGDSAAEAMEADDVETPGPERGDD